MSQPSELDSRPLLQIMAEHDDDVKPEHLMEHAQQTTKAQIRRELTQIMSACTERE